MTKNQKNNEENAQIKLADDEKRDKDPTSSKDERNIFEETLGSFISALDSLNSAYDIIRDVLKENFNKTGKSIKSYSEKLRELRKTKSLGYEEIRNLVVLAKELSSSAIATSIFPKSHFVYLICLYDAFLGKLLGIVFNKQPELLNTSERSLSYSDLVKFDTLNEAKIYLMEKKIESIMRKNHAAQLKWVDNIFNLHFIENMDTWSDFIEITERRNLLVHTDGKVSSQYLQICRENNVDCQGRAIGDNLHVSREYFIDAHDVIFELAVKLTHLLWRKFEPENISQSDGNLVEIGYDTLEIGNYMLTKKIFEFGLNSLTKHSSDKDRRIMIINRALAYKWSGDEEMAIDIIKNEDWSATEDRFKLAEAVILNDYELAYRIMKKIGSESDDIGAGQYREWPLFNAIKEQSKFISVFEEIFNEPYIIVENDVEEKLEKGQPI